MSFEDDLNKGLIDVGKNVAEDIIRPTSKSIGNNIGLLVDGVMGWLGYWGETQRIKRDACLTDYKKKIEQKLVAIPNENLIEPQIRIIGPAIEASKFFIEEESCREQFSRLIASACNSITKEFVHPAFPEMIKQLSATDGKFLQHFKSFSTFPCVEIFMTHKNGIITPYPNLIFDFRGSIPHHTEVEELHLTETIDNIVRLGLITMNQKVIELGYNYDNFKEHWFYTAILPSIEEGDIINMRKYRIELTELGKAFVKCCL